MSPSECITRVCVLTADSKKCIIFPDTELCSKFIFVSWITEQFYPNWELFGTNKIKIDLNPFGKANVISDDILSKYEVTSLLSSRRPRPGGASCASTGPRSASGTSSRPASSTRSLNHRNTSLSSTASWHQTSLQRPSKSVWDCWT